MAKIRRILFLGTFLPFFAVAEPQTPPTVPAGPASTSAAAAAVAGIPAITQDTWADVVKALKLKEFSGKKFSRKLKVAVLDNGFNGYEGEVGKSLPAGTQYHAGKASDADRISDPSYHGLFMAQIVAGVIKESGADADYELHLFNAYGYTKFADAIETVVRDQFDIVLYSQVWEYGGNGDGKGFINALVNKATAAGILWINAAGNFGHLTKLAAVDGKAEGQDEFVVFKTANGKTTDGTTIFCKVPEKEQCNLRLALGWNDFKDDVEAGTEKDLDLVLLDSKKKEIAASDRNQRLKADPNDPKSSLIPRELIELNVAPGAYKVRVKIKSKNFSASQDQLRITASGKGIEMADATTGETLLPPADNPSVIVVGAADDFQTNVSKKLNRPDIYVNSRMKLKDGSQPFSTSNAAALIAGLTALHVGTGVEKTREAVLTKLKAVTVKPVTAPPAVAPDRVADAGGRRSDGQGNSRRRAQAARDQQYNDPYERRPYAGEPWPQQNTGYSRPDPQQAPCLQRARLPYAYPAVQWLLEDGGGEAVVIRGRVAILINYNFTCYQGLCPQPGERLVMTPQGVDLFADQEVAYGLPAGYYPIITRNVPTCR